MARPRGSKNKPKAPETAPETVTETPNAQPEDEIKPTAEPAHKSRFSLLNEIHNSNKERYAQEGEDDETTEENPPEPVEESKEEDKPEVKEPPKEENPVIAKRKFKIDGQEVELTDEEIIERVQKSGAVDKRLEQATKLLEDAKKTTLSPSNPAALPSASPPSKADVGLDDKTLIQEVTKAVIYGDEGQVAKAFEALLGRGRSGDAATQTKGMNSPQEIQSYVLETLAFERGKQLLETPPEQGGYADIKNDPMLFGMFQRREAELRDVHKDTRSYADLYKAIGDEIRTWKEALIAQHIPKTGLEDRDKLKATTGVVRGAGGKVPTAPLETRPKTHEEKLESMRARRGLN